MSRCSNPSKLILAAFVGLSSVATAACADVALASSGRYAAQHTVSGRIQGLELSGGVVGAQLEFDVHIQNDDGPGFLHGATGHCIGIALFEADNPLSSGVCSFEDADGDVLVMRFTEDSYTSAGSSESIGGTGKYADVEVKQTHRTMDWEQLAGARFEASGVRHGRWRVRGD